MYRLTRTTAHFVALLMVASLPSLGQTIDSPQDRPLTSLRDFNNALVDIVDQVRPAVVTVSTQRLVTARPSPFGGDRFFNFFFPDQGRQEAEPRQFAQRGLGSGVIVDANGLVITNNHVIADADSIYVQLSDDRSFLADVVGTDPATDIAVLRIAGENLPHVDFGDSDDLRVGEMVMAIGSPLTANFASSVTMGIVSALGRTGVRLNIDYQDFIQTDAAINPGNSGGPLINLDGRIVGINTAIASRSGGNQGIGFAIPANMVGSVVNSLVETGRVIRGWLGVTIQDVDDNMAAALGLNQMQGALVGDVLNNSPAARAGLAAGDVIVAIDGRSIESSEALRSQVAAIAPGTKIAMTVLRDGQEMQKRVLLGERPTNDALARSPEAPDRPDEEKLGFTAVDLTPAIAREFNLNPEQTGVVVTALQPGRTAATAGLRQGDIVRAVNRRRVTSVEDFLQVLGAVPTGESVLLRASRAGTGFFAAFRMP